MLILDVLFRYIHVVSAVLSVGGAFFLLAVLPAGLRLVDESRRDEVLLKVRRGYKMIVHPAVLGLLVSGVYNTVRLWPKYKLDTAKMHALWGPHLILGLVAMAVSLYLLAGKTLRHNHRTWLKANVGLLLVVILLAATLRQVRLATVDKHWKADQATITRLQAMTRPAAGAAATQPVVATPAATRPAAALPAATQPAVTP